MFLRYGAVTPGPSRECDITFFVKGQPKSARQLRDSTLAACRVQSVTVPSSRVSRACHSPGLRSPPLKKCPNKPMSLNGRLGNSETGGCKEIRQPFANPSPTPRQPFASPSPTFGQPFANPFCQPLSNPLFPWTPGTR